MAEVARPAPGPGEVLLRVHACGLNFADTLMAAGRYQEKPALPFAPGIEVCGTVAALGPGVAGPAPGTRVACFCGAGGLAEYRRGARRRLRAGARGAWPTRRSRAFSSPTAPATSRSPSCARLRARRDAAGARRRRRRRADRGGARRADGRAGHRRGARRREARARRAPPAPTATLDPEADIARRGEGARRRRRGLRTGGRRAFDAALPPRGPGRASCRSASPAARCRGSRPTRLLVKNLTVIGFYFGAWARAAPGGGAREPRRALRLARQGRLRPHVGHVLPLAEANAGARRCCASAAPPARWWCGWRSPATPPRAQSARRRPGARSAPAARPAPRAAPRPRTC